MQLFMNKIHNLVLLRNSNIINYTLKGDELTLIKHKNIKDNKSKIYFGLYIMTKIIFNAIKHQFIFIVINIISTNSLSGL